MYFVIYLLYLFNFIYLFIYFFQKKRACGFFYWYDPPTCPHGRQVLPKLEDKVASLEEMVTEIARLEENVQTYRRRQKWIVGGLIVAVIVVGMLTVSR